MNELTDEERLALLKKGFNLWEILAFEYGVPNDVPTIEDFEKNDVDMIEVGNQDDLTSVKRLVEEEGETRE